MAYERFANGGLSSLESGINDTVTELTVKSAEGFPTTGNFRIVIDSEIMLVTDVQGQTFTVTRGSESSSAVSHDADAAVFHVLTAGSLAQRDIEQTAVGAASIRDDAGQAGRLYIPTTGFIARDNGTDWDMLPLCRCTPPSSGDFTWVNQGTSTVTDTKGMMVLTSQGVSSGENLRCLVKTAPSTPYTITVCILPQSPDYTSASGMGQHGICWRNSSSGNIITYGWGNSTYMGTFCYTQWTDESTISTNVYTDACPQQAPYWIRFSDDGTNRQVELCGDAAGWVPVADPESNSVFLTADQVGVYANSWDTDNGVARVISYLHWEEA